MIIYYDYVIIIKKTPFAVTFPPMFQTGEIEHLQSHKCLTLQSRSQIAMMKCGRDTSVVWKWLSLAMPEQYFLKMNLPVPQNRTVDALVGL